MNRQDIDKIQNATVKAITPKIFRILSAALVQGYRFPLNYDVGVEILGSTALTTRAKVRMDDIIIETTISTVDIPKEHQRIAEALVDQWLEKHALSTPVKKRRARV
jgi:hypothetical protein